MSIVLPILQVVKAGYLTLPEVLKGEVEWADIMMCYDFIALTNDIEDETYKRQIK